MKRSRIAGLLLLTLPLVAFGASAPKDLKGFVDAVISIMENIIVLLFSLTFLVVMWGLIKNWILKGGEAEAITAGKDTVTAGIIGLVVMSSLWGILHLLRMGFFGG